LTLSLAPDPLPEPDEEALGALIGRDCREPSGRVEQAKARGVDTLLECPARARDEERRELEEGVAGARSRARGVHTGCSAKA